MMNARKTVFGGLVCVLAGLILGMSATPAAAQFGPVLSGTGAVNRSMGGASTAAPLSAAGALYWNPATLSGLDRSELEVGVELLAPQTSLFSSVPGLSDTTQNEDAIFPLPTIALSYRPEQSPMTYGLGVYAVAGFGVSYAGSLSNPVLAPPAAGGFGPLFSQYQVLQIAPALVYDVTDRLSVSVSPLLDLGTVQLDPAIISDPNANGTYPSGTHSRSAWGCGYSVGAYYKLDHWGFGASYKSKQWFQPYRFQQTNELGLPRTTEYEIDVPSIVSVGTSYSGIDRLLLAADLRYLDFKQTEGFGESGFSGTGAVNGLGFESIFAVALGAQYQMTDAMSVRLGYSWSENPVPDSQTTVNVVSPLSIQHVISAGASYQVTEAFSLSLAYTHGFENSISTSPIVLPSGAIPGSSIRSTTSVDMLIAGATVKFGCPKRRDCCVPTDAQ